MPVCEMSDRCSQMNGASPMSFNQGLLAGLIDTDTSPAIHPRQARTCPPARGRQYGVIVSFF